MDTKRMMVEYLKQQNRLLTAQEISEAIHVPRHIVYAMLGTIIMMHGFYKQRVKGYIRYGINPSIQRKEKVVCKFGLPDDMWRGWVNPETNIVPARLGTQDKPPVWEFKE